MHWLVSWGIKLVWEDLNNLALIEFIVNLQENGTSSHGGSGCATGGQISAEKKQREHLLQLNQILAQQVMQMSKIVAGKY